MVALVRVASIIVAMTVNEIVARLESLGDDARRAHNTKAGVPDNQFGVKLGDICGMAKKISRFIRRKRAPRLKEADRLISIASEQRKDGQRPLHERE